MPGTNQHWAISLKFLAHGGFEPKILRWQVWHINHLTGVLSWRSKLCTPWSMRIGCNKSTADRTEFLGKKILMTFQSNIYNYYNISMSSYPSIIWFLRQLKNARLVCEIVSQQIETKLIKIVNVWMWQLLRTI
jgi:hypothetical protein